SPWLPHLEGDRAGGRSSLSTRQTPSESRRACESGPNARRQHPGPVRRRGGAPTSREREGEPLMTLGLSEAEIARITWCLAVLQQLAAAPPGAVPAPPWWLSTRSRQDLIRSLAILAQIRDGGATTGSNPLRGGAIPDPLSSKAVPNLLKLPGLFGDIK